MPHVAAIADSHAEDRTAHRGEFRLRTFVKDDDGLVIVVERDKRAGKSRKLPSLARGELIAMVVDVVGNVVFVHVTCGSVLCRYAVAIRQRHEDWQG